MQEPASLLPDRGVPDLVRIDVAAGTRIFATSDLHLAGTPTAASRWSATEVAKALGGWTGPGIAIFAGDLFELWWGEPSDPSGAIAAHPEFIEAVRSFALEEGRRVIYVAGNHDGRMGWDERSVEMAQEALGAQVALAVELTLHSPGGASTVRFEHGHAYDPANRFEDPHNPDDTPLGQHIVQEFLPDLKEVEGDWMDGVETLADPRGFPSFISSRIFYRKVARGLLWLLIPVAVAIALRVPITYAFLHGNPRRVRPFEHALLYLDLAVIVDIAFVAAFLALAVRRSWQAASSVAAEKRGSAQNDNTRDAAVQLIAKGYAGLVCGHTHHPELTTVGTGFYANTGSGTKVIDHVAARFGMPPVFMPRIQVSWVILQSGEPWTVTLVAGRRNLPGATRLERFMASRSEYVPPDPSIVARCP